MTDPTALEQAETRVAVARGRLSRTFGALQARLAPRAIARDAVDTITEGSEHALRTGVDAARRNPGKIAGALALAAALLGRRRIVRMIDKARAPDAEPAQPPPAQRVRSSKARPPQPRPAPARRK